MALLDLPIPESRRAVPDKVRRFLIEADKRVENNLEEARSPAFVPSDYSLVASVLMALSDSLLIRGNCLCEWGSGLGVVASVAAMLGYVSYGIESEWELVDEARTLAADFDTTVTFTHGSFVPEGGESLAVTSGEYAWLSTEMSPAYPKLGMDIDDFDIIFAYPWPDEEQVTFDLFHEFASDGALLLTYRGDGLRLKRKVSRNTRRRR